MATARVNPGGSANSRTPVSKGGILQKMRDNLRSIIVGCIVVILLCLVGLFFYPESPEFKEKSLVARAAASAVRPVEIEARLGQNLFEEIGENVKLQVSITDTDPAKPLSNVRVYAEAPGFEVDHVAHTCGVKNKQRPDETEVGAQQSCTTSIDLRVAQQSGMSAVTVFADWTQGTPQEVSLSLGPVKFDSTFGAARWNRLGRRLAQVMKDLTIPIVLALIGIWFSWRQGLRDENRIAAEKEQADRQQVRMLLLTKVMELEKNHYLPIISETVAILTEEQKGAKRSTDELFFHVLMFLKRMDYLKNKEGGVFFEKRFGEYTAHHAWKIVRTAMYGVLTEEAISAALTTVVGIHWEYAKFLKAKSQVANLQTKFEEWLKPADPKVLTNVSTIYGSFSEYMGALDVIQAVFRFEGDRALSEGWYEEEATIDFKLKSPTTLPIFTGDKQPVITANAEALKIRLETAYGRQADLKQIN